MYDHHKQSIQNLIDYFKDDVSVVAVILGGSVAKECERIDSDIDAIVVVTEEKYSELLENNKLSECITGYCTYENGYFDIKYCTKEYLMSVAEKGSEPARNAFLKAKCLYTADDKIPTLVSQIPVFQKAEKSDKLLSFYSAFSLSHAYFWGASENDIYLRVRSAADIVLFGFRLLLEEGEVLFPCQKSLLKAVSELKNKPENIIKKSNYFLTTLDDASKDDFVHSILSFIAYQPPQDLSEVLTRYTADNELWWYKERPIISEW